MPLFRNNKNLIKELIPSNYIAATVKYVKKQYFYKEIPFVTIGNDATIFNPKERPEIMVIIIGETARAANFKQNGYRRNTTPYTDGINNLKQLNLL